MFSCGLVQPRHLSFVDAAVGKFLLNWSRTLRLNGYCKVLMAFFRHLNNRRCILRSVIIHYCLWIPQYSESSIFCIVGNDSIPNGLIQNLWQYARYMYECANVRTHTYIFNSLNIFVKICTYHYKLSTVTQ